MNSLKYYELEVKEQISCAFSKLEEIKKDNPNKSRSDNYILGILKKLLALYSSILSNISTQPKEIQNRFIQHIQIYIQIQFSENQSFYNDLFQYFLNSITIQPNILLDSLKKLNQVSLLQELVKDYIIFDISNQYSQVDLKNCESLLNQIIIKVEKQYLNYFISIADIVDMRMILENELKPYINNLLVKNIYLIIIHYPHTTCYLHDIYKTIKREEDVYNKISNELSNNIITKLLRKDNTTMLILQIYVNIIKSLHIIDKNDIIINKSINDIIKKYLRNRKDTIQCIIENITDPNMSNIFIMDNYDDENKGISNDNEWNAELRELNNNHMKMNTNDLLRIFVNIFGNENDFMNEYHLLLYKRLLLHHSNIQQEIKIVKELHRLFNHSLLKSFDVMLNDIIESKKINKEITLNHPFPINSLILSHYYWPDMKTYNIKWHKSIKSYIQKFMLNYNDKYSPSIFQWYIFEGKVTFDLTINDKTKEFELCPILLNILLYFGDKNEWQLNELSEVIHLEIESMKSCLLKLISYGIIEFNSKSSRYSVVEELNSNLEENEIDEIEEDEEEDVEKTNKRVLETYIKMILNNIGKSPIEKIHKMLQVFIVGQNKYEKTIDELFNILDELCKRKELDLENGLYTALKIV